MNKSRMAWLIILLSIVGILFYFRGQQVSRAKEKAFGIAIQKAKSLGYEVDRMGISKEDLYDNWLVVSFKSNNQNKINDLEIYLRCENIYEINILGIFKDVDPERDREKIALEILRGSIKEIKEVTQKLNTPSKQE